MQNTRMKMLSIFMVAIIFFCFVACTKQSKPSSELVGAVENIQGPQTIQPTQEPVENAEQQNFEYRAVWISYLEFEQMDFSSEQSFTDSISIMFDSCEQAGINTVVVQVRPFGDAFYKSDIFPTSHIIAGEQGGEIAYDPLKIMVDQAHNRGLRIEAWVNPYRIKLTEKKPATLANTNPATAFMANDQTKDYIFSANGGLYYNPAIPQVRQLITDGVAEIITKYGVDGIQFDDYFYPEGAGTDFDKPYYALESRTISFEDWRRENVNKLVSQVYAAIKMQNPKVVFGISPQGNNDNNYNTQYSDVALWLAEEGYVDYVMPQIYWGYNFTLKNGSDKFSYQNCLSEWLAMPKHQNVKLYIGLAPFRIGIGDGSSTQTDEWQSGENTAKMIKDLRVAGADGYALYRYDSVFNNPEHTALAQAEVVAIAQANQ